MTTLTDLAERVEKLTGPCRETDALLALVAGCTEISYRVYRGPDGKYIGSAPYYTRSRDAAMSLRLDWMSVETTESAPEPQFTRCRIWDWRRSPTMSDPGNEWKADSRADSHTEVFAMKSTDTICTEGQDKLCWFFCAAALVAGLAVLLTGCSDGPSESDMRGCATRRAGTPITHSDVADCAVERAARQGEVK